MIFFFIEYAIVQYCQLPSLALDLVYRVSKININRPAVFPVHPALRNRK